MAPIYPNDNRRGSRGWDSFTWAWVGIAIIIAAFISSPVMAEKPRVLVLTDISNEPDDTGSLIRFLNYSEQFDIEGLIATTSVHLPNVTRPEQIASIVNLYGQVRPNLLLHAPDYPTASFLLATVKNGLPKLGMAGVGTGKDSEGSEWIISVVDKSDSRPVWISVWGGPNTLAQALWKIRATRTNAQLTEFIAKLRVYAISDQDDSGSWIRTNFPQLFYIVSPGENGYTATWSGISGERNFNFPCGADFNLVSNAWADIHVKANHGPLGAAYPYMPYIMEGDTPSFLYLLPNGLGDPEKPNFGGWGGRYVWKNNIYTDTSDTVLGIDGKTYTDGHATIWRWREAYQNDFQARMDWNVKPFAEVNHSPSANVEGTLQRTVVGGQTVSLSAAGTTDPDAGNVLSYRWTQYQEAGTYPGAIVLSQADSQTASFVAPRVSAPVEIHIILTVTDNGAPRLFGYKRVIVSVLPEDAPTPPVLTANDAANTLSASHVLGASEIEVSIDGGIYAVYTGTISVGNIVRPAGYWKFRIKAGPLRSASVSVASPAFTRDVNTISTFHRGVNFGGNAQTINGNLWLGYTAALGQGLSFPQAVKTAQTNITVLPATDAEMSAMLNSAVYAGGNLSVVQTLADGTYQVKFWIMENYASNHRSFDLYLEGQKVAAGLGDGMAKGSYLLAGPYYVQVNDGKLNIDMNAVRTDAHLMGMEIFLESIMSAPPTLTANDQTNTLSASHALGDSEIEVSVDGGRFSAYTGEIDVGNQAVTSGFWSFKIKASSARTESLVVKSPAFTDGGRFTFSSWRKTNFVSSELSEDSISGAIADPDYDGQSNLLEYSLCSDPKVSGKNPLRMELLNHHLTLSYSVDLTRTSFAITAEGSADLLTWMDAPAATVVSTIGQIQTRQVAIPMTGSTRFLRLKASAP